MRVLAPLCLAIALAGCGDPLPDLQAGLSPAARSADWPDLVPLGPLLADTGALLPRDAEVEGQSLEARAEDLRRRAAALRALALP